MNWIEIKILKGYQFGYNYYHCDTEEGSKTSNHGKHITKTGLTMNQAKKSSKYFEDFSFSNFFRICKKNYLSSRTDPA
jgi:hypothetical protein